MSIEFTKKCEIRVCQKNNFSHNSLEINRYTYFACLFVYIQDIRIEGGYEAVPTRDIHMRQIGFDETWLEFLEQYVMPLQEAAFMQYASEVGFLFLNALQYTYGTKQ